VNVETPGAILEKAGQPNPAMNTDFLAMDRDSMIVNALSWPGSAQHSRVGPSQRP